MLRVKFLSVVVVLVCATGMAVSARADAFTSYALSGSFNLPQSSEFDVLGDGRLVSLVGADLYAETAVGSRAFSLLGTLPGADFNAGPYGGPAFVRVSPDGTRIAVGNGGGASWNHFQVGIFNLGDLSGHWFNVNHFDGEWIDDTRLALTASATGQTSAVTALDTSSNPAGPINPAVVANIGGLVAGVAFDTAGNLFTGNGYASAGPSDTGWIKAFPASSWTAALLGGTPVDFEAGGTLIADLLSAAALGFDAEGNLHVGGGDYAGGDDQDNAALVRSSAVADALAGNGPADPYNPLQVRRFDPDAANPYNFYDVNYNNVTGELYVREGATVYVYSVPEPGSCALALALVSLVTARRRVGTASIGAGGSDHAA